jgi:hypothetical protein
MTLTHAVRADYHQFYVLAGSGFGGCQMGDVTDGLVHQLGASGVGVSTGAYMATIQVQVNVGPAGKPGEGWSAISESEIVADEHGVWLTNWDGSNVAQLVTAAGLYRLRASARGRGAGRAREQDRNAVGEVEPEVYRLDLWPVTENCGLRPLRRDSLAETLSIIGVERAAARAVISLVPDPEPPPPGAPAFLPDGRPIPRKGMYEATPLVRGLSTVRVIREHAFDGTAAEISPLSMDSVLDLVPAAYAPHPLAAARSTDETVRRMTPLVQAAVPGFTRSVIAEGDRTCLVRLETSVPAGQSGPVGDMATWMLLRLAAHAEAARYTRVSRPPSTPM